MGTIVGFLKDDNVFEPGDIAAMSHALDDVCATLKLGGNAVAKEIVAIRIIDLARGGARDPIELRDRVLAEAKEHVTL